jgi:hypothetical protein
MLVSASGPGRSLALLDAANGDTILFSPAVFPPGSPAMIVLKSGLADVTQDALTIDASDAGVILDGTSTGGGAPGRSVLADGAAMRAYGS